MHWVTKLIIGAMVAAVLGGAAMWRWHAAADAGPGLQTVTVKRGALVAVIGATGTVEPEEVVDVGAQVAGQINSFGNDANGKQVDYGSPVEVGTVLAQIDDSLYAETVEQAKASLNSAEASVQQMQAKLVQAQRDWDRVRPFEIGGTISATLYDQYRAAFETAKPNLAGAQAAVAQATAVLHAAQRNLAYCTIKSPVKGVVIDRRVNIGQTVVSSLSAPSLFLLAKDLHRVQVWVSVNEADIGHIRPGGVVTFTVDAFPGQSFHGTVGKIRLNATMTQNVVTYTVEVNTDNPDGKLLPYLTANVHFEIARRDDVLMVPNVALRWWPDADRISPDFRSKRPATGRPSRPSGPSATAGEESVRGTAWVVAGQFVKPVEVIAGLTDGTMTEVSGPDVKEALQVVVGEQTPETAKTTAANVSGASPFTPQLRRSSPSGGGAK